MSDVTHRRRNVLIVAVIALATAGLSFGWEFGVLGRPGQLELDRTSEFSHIRIRRTDHLRSLLFVRDSGEEVVETTLDLQHPHRLVSPYTRFMFLSYLFQPQPKRVLIVGLGGGAMVHFLRQHDHQLKIDVVEIDPVIVEIASQYFGIRPSSKVQIITRDAVEYFGDADATYDVIYMDAFLKPTADTDASGVPLELKAHDFYAIVKKRLAADGLVVFNLNPHPELHRDVAEISASFPQTYAYRLPGGAGFVVVASLAPRREPLSALIAKARALDARFRTSYSFVAMTRTLVAE